MNLSQSISPKFKPFKGTPKSTFPSGNPTYGLNISKLGGPIKSANPNAGFNIYKKTGSRYNLAQGVGY